MPGAFEPVERVQPTFVQEDATSAALAAYQLMLDNRKALGIPNLAIKSLADFRKLPPAIPLSQQDKLLAIDQAGLLFSDLYANLRFKRVSSPGPVEQLQAFKDEITRQDMADADFHARMIDIFGCVADSHTTYELPEPWGSSVAFVPFTFRVWFDPAGTGPIIDNEPLLEGNPRFLVNRLLNGFTGEKIPFKSGVEITHWNGRRIAEFILDASGRLPAVRPATRIARGILTAVSRPLILCRMPEEPSAFINYKVPGSDVVHMITIPWAVAMNIEVPRIPSAAFSHALASDLSLTVARLFKPVGDEELLDLGGSRAFALARRANPQRRSSGAFEVQFTGGDPETGLVDPKLLAHPLNNDAHFGYIRIRTFFSADPLTDLPGEFKDILDGLVRDKRAPDGLIIDLRGNSGGKIEDAEMMLQFLSPVAIQPMVYRLANTPPLRDSLQQITDPDSVLRPWIDSLPRWSPTDPLSPGFPITQAKLDPNNQVYKGPCILITDALTYSAAEVFAAQFQDHQLGMVIGLDDHTGGGGANSWYHSTVVANLKQTADFRLSGLPGQLNMNVAFRRCVRVGRNEGKALEDVGVRPNFVHAVTTPAEALSSFDRAVFIACLHLADRRPFTIQPRAAHVNGELMEITFNNQNIEQVTVSGYGVIGADPIFRIKPNQSNTIEFQVTPFIDRYDLKLEGFSTLGGQMVPVTTYWMWPVMKKSSFRKRKPPE